MLQFGPTFVWVAVNLLVLYFIMKRLFFRPVSEFMQNRANSIKDAINSAESDKRDASRIKKEYEDRLKLARDEAEKILNEARSKAGKEYDSIVGMAKRDAEGIFTKSREEIERERVVMLKGVRENVADLAISAAARIIEANMNNATNKQLVDKFIDEKGAA